jgi:hypothetical protein
MTEETMRFIAIGQHRSEYPHPITFARGTPLVIGDRYEGAEGWDNWYFCTIPTHSGGWVPEQLIERGMHPGHGVAKDDYTAKELDVDEGDEFQAIKFLNGWLWCQRLSNNDIGWVPMSILQSIK